MPFVNKILRLIDRNRLQKIELFAKKPYEVQESQLKSLIAAARDTEWGRRFNFADIKNIAEYQKRVP